MVGEPRGADHVRAAIDNGMLPLDQNPVPARHRPDKTCPSPKSTFTEPVRSRSESTSQKQYRNKCPRRAYLCLRLATLVSACKWRPPP